MLFTLSVIIFHIVVSCEKGKVFEYPEFDRNLSLSELSVERIELTDTATVLDVALYTQPGYWIKLSSKVKLIGKNTGNEYPLKWMEGLAPDVQLHVDSTGFITARLFFNPLDVSDNEIDFIDPEGRETGIMGIKLYNTTKGKIKTTLSGKLVAMGASWLLLIEAKRNQGKIYNIPVREGKFNFDIYTEEPRVFYVYIGKEYKEGLVSKVPKFWSEGGEVRLEFLDGTSEDFILEGGPLTSEFQAMTKRKIEFNDRFSEKFPEIKKMEKMKEDKTLYSDEYYSLRDSLRKSTLGWKRQQIHRKIYAMSDSIYFSPEGEIVFDDYRRIYSLYKDTIKSAERDFLLRERSNPTMSNLYDLYREVEYMLGDIDSNLELYETFYKNFHPEHYYNKTLAEASELLSPVIGNHYINFTIPGKGKTDRQLSDIIENKHVLIFLWSGNSPKSRERVQDLLALYKKFNSRGFEIVGIAKEDQSEQTIKKLIKQENHPWETLIDFKGSIGAWTKYRLGNAAGRLILINSDGIFVAIDPSISELKQYLESNLL